MLICGGAVSMLICGGAVSMLICGGAVSMLICGGAVSMLICGGAVGSLKFSASIEGEEAAALFIMMVGAEVGAVAGSSSFPCCC